MNPKGKARKACDSDIETIEAWLPKDKSIPSLAVNWETTKRVYRERGMWVWEDSTGEPVAYFWGAFYRGESILEVRPEYRGRGVGRAFVEFLVELSRSLQEPLLEVECSPDSSADFWSAMGFTVQDGGRYIIARRILSIPQVLPGGQKSSVTVSFFSGEALYKRERNVQPITKYPLLGATHAGELTLSEKVGWFYLPGGSDLVVKLEVEGKTIYFGKARSSEAAKFGVTDAGVGFTIGQIRLGSTDV